MNNDWKNYLLQHNGKQDEKGLFVFNDNYADEQRSAEEDIICDLSHFSTMVVAGGDAAELLQGQLTNDIDKIDKNSSQISGFCNRKGRMIANFRLFLHQNNYFISIKSDLVEHSIQHLQNYVLRSEVAIQDISEQLIHLGLSGDNADKLLAPFVEGLNVVVDSVTFNENYIVIRVPGKPPRYEIFCSFEHAKTLWEAIAAKVSLANSAYWDYLNIQNGLPFIDNDTCEEFVPQMANMELINGISFEKGCYTGQEIVARTHYLGKQKRRTYHINILTDGKPKAGQQLATETSTENQYIGTLITVHATAENKYEALAVIQIKSAEQEKLKLKDSASDITLLELPYSLTQEE